MAANGWSLRDLYRTLDTLGTNRLRDDHATLDAAVRAAYGMKQEEDPVAFLLNLNLQLAHLESRGQPISSPGLARLATNADELTTTDCIRST